FNLAVTLILRSGRICSGLFFIMCCQFPLLPLDYSLRPWLLQRWLLATWSCSSILPGYLLKSYCKLGPIPEHETHRDRSFKAILELRFFPSPTGRNRGIR